MAVLDGHGPEGAGLDDQADAAAGPVVSAAMPATPAAAPVRDTPPTVVRDHSPWQRQYVRACVAADVVAACMAAAVAYLGRFEAGWHPAYVWTSLLLVAVWPAVVAANRAYEPRFLGSGSEEFRRVGRAAIVLTAVVTFTAYLIDVRVGRHYLLIALPTLALATFAGRYLLRRWVAHQREQGRFVHRTVLVGHEDGVLDLVERLGEERYHGLRIVAVCLPTRGQRPALIEAGIPVVGGFESVAAAVRLSDADTVAVLANADFGSEQLRQLAWDIEPSGAELLVAPSLVEVAGPRLSIRPVSGLPLLHVEQPRFSGGRRLVKATVDRTVAALALLVLSPLLALIAVAVRATSRGPVIFRQQRIGRDGEPFTMLKFRSMVDDAEGRRGELLSLSDGNEVMFKMHTDPRVTPVGRVLRRYSLDELPQLINVLLGQMSLVGPRPPLPSEVTQYTRQVARRLKVPPGITGLWQISGRSDLSWDEAVRLDLRYVDNWSLALDLLILWKTARAVLEGHGAY